MLSTRIQNAVAGSAPAASDERISRVPPLVKGAMQLLYLYICRQCHLFKNETAVARRHLPDPGDKPKLGAIHNLSPIFGSICSAKYINKNISRPHHDLGNVCRKCLTEMHPRHEFENMTSLILALKLHLKPFV